MTVPTWLTAAIRRLQVRVAPSQPESEDLYFVDRHVGDSGGTPAAWLHIIRDLREALLLDAVVDRGATATLAEDLTHRRTMSDAEG